MRRAARVDDNHKEITDALRDIGATVQSLAALGQGVPDLLVARQGGLWLMEVKDGKKPPSKRKLTPDEEAWIAAWAAPVHIVESIEQALAVVGAIEG